MRKVKVLSGDADGSSELEYQDDAGTMASDSDSEREAELVLQHLAKVMWAAKLMESIRIPSKHPCEDNGATVPPRRRPKAPEVYASGCAETLAHPFIALSPCPTPPHAKQPKGKQCAAAGVADLVSIPKTIRAGNSITHVYHTAQGQFVSSSR